MKNRSVVFAGLVSLLVSPLANADLAKAGHEIKETAVDVAHKAAQVGQEIGHATAETAKSVGHAVTENARKGYQAVRGAVTDPAPSPNSPPDNGKN